MRDEPDLVAELPQDVIALEWGYEADYPFAEHAALIAKSGRSFYVCPGTSSWNTLAGRTDNALGNLRNAAVNGYAHGAIGYLNTDWGDNGHMQPLPVSYLGYLAGACMSWNVESASAEDEPDWPALLDAHLFRDRAGVMGRLAYDMGLVYRLAGPRIHNSSPLFWLLILPDALPEGRVPAATELRTFRQAEARIDEVMRALDSADMRCEDAELVTAEYRWVADMLRWACRLGKARWKVGLDQPVEAIDAATRESLAADLAPLIDRHRAAGCSAAGPAASTTRRRAWKPCWPDCARVGLGEEDDDFARLDRDVERRRAVDKRAPPVLVQRADLLLRRRARMGITPSTGALQAKDQATLLRTE